MWDPLLVAPTEPLKVVTSNLVQNWDLVSSLPKTTFRDRIDGGLG